MAMLQYWAFGLHISSEIEFPEFLPAAFSEPDLLIKVGEVPDELVDEEEVHQGNPSMTANRYLQTIPNIASFYVTNGNQITLCMHEGAHIDSARLFLLSNAMAAVLHQRNMIPLHASAVFHAGGVVLFCGHSGAGKSTIVTALQAKGYKVFTDDVCVIKPGDADEAGVMVLPSYPMMKLWLDSFEKTGILKTDDDARLQPHMDKYGRYYHEGYNTNPMPVKQVFIIDARSAEDQPVLKKLGSLESFNALQRNTYRYGQMNGMKKRNFHFSSIAKLAAAVPVYRLSRMAQVNTISHIVELIESCLPASVEAK
jgi:hypothetical protein